MVEYKENECTCEEEAIEEHVCPFAVDIRDDDTPCRCCESCTWECARNR